jgi:hypothetical protein
LFGRFAAAFTPKRGKTFFVLNIPKHSLEQYKSNVRFNLTLQKLDNGKFLMRWAILSPCDD